MVDSKRRRIKEFGVPRSLFTVHRSPGARVWGSIGVGAHRYPDAKFQIDSDLRGLRAIIGQNLVFLRGFSENSFASLINRAPPSPRLRRELQSNAPPLSDQCRLSRLEISAITEGSNSCSAAWMRACNRSAVSSGIMGTVRCARILPVSTPAST
jgi:hypothetical protein